MTKEKALDRVAEIRAEDMRLVPSGTLTAEQWREVVSELIGVIGAAQEAEYAARRLSAGCPSFFRLDFEAQAKTTIHNMRRMLDALAVKIASIEHKAVKP